ncbi:MAG: HutD family protein [Burkholderiales bacterium]|nr:HutD family protein [Burkholderiales bacterium]
MNRHVHRCALADLPPQRWRNGGGVTRAPAGAGDFDWRVSVAEIAAAIAVQWRPR